MEKNEVMRLKPFKNLTNKGMLVENLADYSKDEIKNLIYENLKETGVNSDLVSIKVLSGSKIRISGDVNSKKEKRIIVQTIMDVLGIEEIIDDLEILGSEFIDLEDDDDYQGELLDDDNQSMGSEDLYSALEDGVPYVPPITSPFDEDQEDSRAKRRKRRRGHDAF